MRRVLFSARGDEYKSLIHIRVFRITASRRGVVTNGNIGEIENEQIRETGNACCRPVEIARCEVLIVRVMKFIDKTPDEPTA